MYMNMRDYLTLHVVTIKGIACSKNGTDVNGHKRLSNITLRHKLKEQLVVR